MPSYQKFEDNKTMIRNTEKRLLQLHVERQNLQAELDKIPSSRQKTMKQKMRKEELEDRIEFVAQDIGKMKKKIRDIELSDKN